MKQKNGAQLSGSESVDSVEESSESQQGQDFYRSLDFSTLGEVVEVASAEHEIVRELLGREPLGAFSVSVRDSDGRPRVIKNYPVLATGRPMPTLYWLVSEEDRLIVSRLESAGAVRLCDEILDEDEIARSHEAYARERDALLPEGYLGYRPSGGVGGTRKGVKCLHAHYAYYLAGGVDPVGRWVQEQIDSGTEIVPGEYEAVSERLGDSE